jgi:hypothetical protein
VVFVGDGPLIVDALESDGEAHGERDWLLVAVSVGEVAAAEKTMGVGDIIAGNDLDLVEAEAAGNRGWEEVVLP